jgi:hypothetical protein
VFESIAHTSLTEGLQKIIDAAHDAMEALQERDTQSPQRHTDYNELDPEGDGGGSSKVF